MASNWRSQLTVRFQLAKVRFTTFLQIRSEFCASRYLGIALRCFEVLTDPVLSLFRPMRNLARRVVTRGINTSRSITCLVGGHNPNGGISFARRAPTC